MLKISQPYGVSLDDIKHEAIVLYCDTTGMERHVFESQSVTVELEFRDNEGDIIIVKTDLDLRNFSSSLPSSYIGKVFANVSSTTPKVKSESGAGTESTSVTTQTDSKVGEKNSEDQKIVNAIADIFTIAAVSMKAGITAAMTAKHLSSAAANETVDKKEAKNAHKVSKENLKAAKRLAREHYKMLHLHRSMRHGGVINSVAAMTVSLEPSTAEKSTDASLDDHRPAVMDGNNVENVVDGGTKKENHVENAPSVLPPFIHGRHTCDQCLTTPIVGTRYHALNLPDYDLCAICFGNYKGSEIVFEEAQLGT